jgi:hypothetical protein
MQEATLSFVSFIRWFVRSIVERMQEATLSSCSFVGSIDHRVDEKQYCLSFHTSLGSFIEKVGRRMIT